MAASIPLHIGPTGVRAALDALHGAGGWAVIGVPTPFTEDRTTARQTLRTAVQDLLAQFWQCPVQRIQFSSQPGQALALLDAPGPMQLCFSHAPGLSVAALHRHQPAGVDILRTDSVLQGGAAERFAQVKEEPAQRAGDTEQNALPPRRLGDGTGLLSDWEQLARDYLGPAAYQGLQRSPAQARARLFAQHWSDLEAGLKCLGLGLQEWSPELQHALARCQQTRLELPPTLATRYCGALALMHSPTAQASDTGRTAAL